MKIKFLMQRMKFIGAIMCVLFISGELQAKNWFSTFAVVVDGVTYSKIKTDVDAYVTSVQTLDRKGILVIDKWNCPDSLRAVLNKMYKNNNLEGAVFIGDIPVPMIRDAHHLTTAFKMNPKRDWKDSSVPSDRFYDDFDLKFDYLKQDSEIKLYHYYSLRADSPQSISCDIYSARIKAPAVPGKNKYELIGAYLKKAVTDKANKREMAKIMHFAGHGYNSESMNARIDEATALGEQFPFINNKPGCDLDYIDYTFDNYIKYRLMAALADKKLDLAILHHHGADDTQLLNGSPIVSDAKNQIELAKKFFRSKIRSAKDSTKSKEYYVKEYDIPQDWVSNAFNPKIIESDSLHDASLDINIPDMYGYISEAKIVILDACFNGSFHLDDYISGYYIFNPGSTMVVKANSVNTLQDTWTNELMGILSYGVCAGNWAKGQMTLESHLLGDPTFCFTPIKELFTQTKDFDLNRDITKERTNVKYWNNLLNSNTPDIKCLAIHMLLNNKAINSTQLLDIQHTSPSAVVRLEAFISNKKISDNNLLKAIELGMQDSYELLQRLSVITAAKNGNPILMPLVAKMSVSPVTSSRIDFQIKYIIDGFNGADFIIELENARKQSPYWPTQSVYKSKINNIMKAYEGSKADFAALLDDKVSVKEKGFTISGQRNGCNNMALDNFFTLLSTSNDNAMRLSVVETLGWYKYSYRKEEIIAKCKEFYKIEKDAAVKNELLKTINRLY
ncbi:MAG: hypothetical protein RR919_06050 [Bacteroidales bacterium]